MQKKSFIFDFMYHHRSALCLLALFVFSACLRIFQLGALPFGLHEDEIMNGYVGRFILLNGKDLYGNSWPLLYFNNFGDYPPVIPMYFSGISTFLFGVTVFAVRFPIAVFGSLAVFPMYFLTRKIFIKERYAFLSSFLLALMPWHILLSRSTAENVTATTFSLVSLYLLFEYQQKRKIWQIVLMVSLLFSQYFLYASFRVLIPAFLFFAIFLAKDKRWRVTLLALTVLFSCMTFAIGKTSWGEGRFKQTSIFYFNNTLDGRITHFHQEEGEGNILISKIFHNKPVVYTREFIRQYGTYFSPAFLFTDGGLPHRYLLNDTGLLYLSFIVLAITSLLMKLAFEERKKDVIWTKDGRKSFLYLFVLLLLSPIPAALTLDDVPNVHRSLLLGILILFPVTYIFSDLEKYQWKKISLQALFLFMIAIEFIYFMHQFSVHVPYTQSTFRGDDRTSLAEFLRTNRTQYDKIVLPHDAKPLYYLFATENFDKDLAGKFGENIELPSVDNLLFLGDNCPSQTIQASPTASSLVIDRGQCSIPPGYTEVTRIIRRDGSGSFRAVRKIATPSAIQQK